MISKLGPSVDHTPGAISLLENPSVTRYNAELVKIFDSMATQHLRYESAARLSKRIRRYDGHQRLTFGRASTRPMSYEEIVSAIDLSRFAHVDQPGNDASFFPEDLSSASFRPLNDVLKYSIHTLIEPIGLLWENSLVTIFCHRVLVRPQETYKGFLHRDLAPRSGNIGTVVWYPQVKHRLIEGLSLIA